MPLPCQHEDAVLAIRVLLQRLYANTRSIGPVDDNVDGVGYPYAPL